MTSLDTETLALRAANGEIDLAGSELGFQAAPVLIKNAEAKQYNVLRWQPDGMFNVVYLNLSHPDPVMRELFQNIDFRAGALPRDQPAGDQRGAARRPGRHRPPVRAAGDPYYVKGMGQRFIEYDAAMANELLDKAGLTARAADGFRLAPGRQDR